MLSLERGITIRPKRNRQAYLRIQQQMRQTTDSRRRRIEHVRTASIETFTFMVMVKDALALPLSEEEKKWADPSIFESLPIHPATKVVQALKYLNAEFTPKKLYHVWEKCNRDYVTIKDWLDVRWAIIEHVEGRAGYGIIPSRIHGFEQEDFFFSDRVVNPSGVNHTEWKLVRARTGAIDAATLQAKPWWKLLFVWCKCKDYQ